MKNAAKIQFILFIPVIILGVLLINVVFVKASGLPQFSQNEAVLNVGEQITVKILNGEDGLIVWSDIPAVKTTLSAPGTVTIIAVKEGRAKVKACTRLVDCAMLDVTVGNKNAPAVAAKTTTNKTPLAIKAAPKKSAVKSIVTKPAKAKTAKASKAVAPAPIVRPSNTINDNALIVSQTNVTIRKLDSVDIYVQERDTVTAKSDSAVVRLAVNANPSAHNVRITLYGMETGSANVKICDLDLNCSTARVLVLPSAAAPFTVSQNYLTIYSGESAWINASGKVRYISTSDLWLVNAKVTDNLVLIVASNGTGKATLKICGGQSANDCTLVYVKVISKPATQKVSGSFSSVTIVEGQSVDVPFPSDFVLSYRPIGSVGDPSETSVASVTVNARSFTIRGKAAGATIFLLCPTTSGYPCGTIGVAVVRSLSCGTNAGKLALSQRSVTMEQTQMPVSITASNCMGLSALSSNSVVVRTSVAGNKVSLYPTNVGSATVQVCDGFGACVPVSVNVVSTR